MQKPIKVAITGNALEQFEELSAIAGDEISDEVIDSNKQTLFNAIKEKIDFLKRNPYFGIQIPKSRIPTKYLKLHEVGNLWKINLPGAWRVIYTIKGDEVGVTSVILDIFTHKTYEKTFGYRRN